MRILDVEEVGWDEVETRLRDVRLVQDERVAPYENARIELRREVEADCMDPAQRYALEPVLAQVGALVDALAVAGHDLFALEGGLLVRTDEEPSTQRWVIPPILERGAFRDGTPALILADGIHRAFVARRRRRRMTAIVVDDVAPEVPYYAWPEPDAWAAVEVKPSLEPGYQKKDYLREDGYQALYRDYDAAFPGVQPPRPQTHPDGYRP
jgi:hypothetical protein